MGPLPSCQPVVGPLPLCATFDGGNLFDQKVYQSGSASAGTQHPSSMSVISMKVRNEPTPSPRNVNSSALGWVSFCFAKNEGLSVNRNNYRKYRPSLSTSCMEGTTTVKPQARLRRAGTRRNCEQQCMQGDIATGEATLPGRCATTGEGQTWLSPLQVTPRKCVQPVRPSPTDLRGEDNEPGLPPSPDNSGYVRSSVSWPQQGHAIVPVCSGLSRHESGLTPESCQWRVVILHAVGARRQQPPVCGCQCDVVATDPDHGPSRSFAHGRLPHGTRAAAL